jgi:hypothetical protein
MGCISGCFEEKHYDYRGYDIPGSLDPNGKTRIIIVPNFSPVSYPEQCAKLCAEEDLCKFWTYNSAMQCDGVQCSPTKWRGGECYLKTSSAGRWKTFSAGKYNSQYSTSGNKMCGVKYLI